MSHNKLYGFIKQRLFSRIIQVMVTWLGLFGTMTLEEKVEAHSASSGLWCISDCATCPVICSPPPPILVTKPYSPPPSPSVPHSPPSPISYHTYSPPPPPFPLKSQSPPPPPFKSYNTPPSGSSQPLPTVVAGPHDFSYPYYYFYASAAPSLPFLPPFLISLLILPTCLFFCC